MKKIFIDTLGCEKNTYDSQMLAAALTDRGCIVMSDAADADIMIVNTCGFIDDAKRESIEHIFNLAAIKGEDKKLIVTGCLSQRYHDELVSEMPEVDMFFGVNDYDEMADVLTEEKSGSDGSDLVGTSVDNLTYRKRSFGDNPYTGVLKIAEGCNNMCAFCAIPLIRGKFRSKKMEDCIREAEDMAAAGTKELIVIAQDTSQYGIDLYGRLALPELLTKLCQIDGIEWIRLMYVYDNGITDELIDVISREDKICKYIDIPIQHISDNVLKLMGRRSTGESIRATIKKLRERIPDIHVRTTLLVGFPGETEDDMKELLDFIDTEKIDRAGAFAYSDEEGTRAYGFEGKLDEETKVSRRDAVMEHQMRVSEALNEKKIGRTYEVMIDEIIEPGVYAGRTRYDAPEIDCEVTFSGSTGKKPGDIINVLINNAYEYDLEGEEI